MTEKQILKIGQISVPGSQAGQVYGEGGVSPTICACTHGYAIGYIVTKVSVDRQDKLLSGRKLLERHDI